MFDPRFFLSRESLVYFLVSGLSLGLLLVFIVSGWPGDPNKCVLEPSESSCFCESFVVEDVENHEPGVRQPWNTWSNLYSLVTGFVVAYAAWRQRRRPRAADETNAIRVFSFYALVYIGVVIFLGLGSMWFHASMTYWGGVVDGASMELLTAFIVFYTLVRIFRRGLIFVIGYPCAVTLLTVLHAFEVDSLILIVVQMALYTVLEAVILFLPHVRSRAGSWAHYGKFWLPGIGSIGLAVLFWALSSDPGDLLCFPGGFQFHSLWHLFAGVAATLLYFFWRDAGR